MLYRLIRRDAQACIVLSANFTSLSCCCTLHSHTIATTNNEKKIDFTMSTGKS
jgi:hypothetical protein